ncbi:c-type cytochrome [Salipiger bermudensis]|uniref:c-type cytochrome n=1 Tax=Salipiger bermudensis TaxID=344736 RepID=UPI001CD60691|nr:cytochrome c [Salipiger bermudensis]MCA0961837.1 cytochrome c [Salipiger bermudensis]
MKKYAFPALGAACIGAIGYAFWPATPETATSQEGAAVVTVTRPSALTPQAELGKRAFDAVCAACHGENAAGKMGFGPPLVHKIYEPSHHGDMAFLVAAQQGVRAHHWEFGNMPPQPQLTQAEVKTIIAYVRELQRANGIN